jgi:hypothetical protein
MILYRPAVGIGVIGFHLEMTIKVELPVYVAKRTNDLLPFG